MKQILDRLGLYVIENGVKYAYKRIYTDSHIPNYYPNAAKNAVYKDMYIDEVLFLPIEKDVFENDHKNKFYGFRYLFNSSGHSTISLGPDPLKLGVTKVQLIIEIQRIRYYVDKDLNVVIDKVCDPLYPPYMVNMQAKSSQVGAILNKYVHDMIDEYDNYYIDKNI